MPSSAAELINSFTSEITVSESGDASIRETISVHSEQHQIEHGIFKDFPNSSYYVQSVICDGRPAEYKVIDNASSRRVIIGNPKRRLDVGDHTFVIAYRVSAASRAFPKLDEIYWNVTGNSWTFPINEAVARVRVPRLVIQFASYTGPVGSKANYAKAKQLGPMAIEFRTTQSLQAAEGLTVAVGYRKALSAN